MSRYSLSSFHDSHDSHSIIIIISSCVLRLYALFLSLALSVFLSCLLWSVLRLLLGGQAGVLASTLQGISKNWRAGIFNLRTRHV